MSDPSDFLDFNSYMGLNAEAAEAMKRRVVGGEGGRLRNEARRLSDEQYLNAKGGTDEEYAQRGAAATKGLASYNDFMQGMVDPAFRQSLMEKVYGKGSVSWLDSAAMGSAQNAEDDSFRAGLKGRAEQAGGRRAAAQDMQRQQAGVDARWEADRAAAAQARAAAEAKKAAEDEEYSVDAYARRLHDADSNPFKDPYSYDPNGIRKTTGTTTETQRDWVRAKLKEDEAKSGMKWKASRGQTGTWGTPAKPVNNQASNVKKAGGRGVW